MGHKVNPYSFRLQLTKDWKSKWFAKPGDYKRFLLQDFQIRKAIAKKLSRGSGVGKVEIERFTNNISVNIFTSKPGIVIGRGGSGVEEMRKQLEKIVAGPIKLSVMEMPHPELVAQIIADNIAAQIEKRISYKRAIKQSVEAGMRAGAKGIKISMSGRLGGAEMSRKETQQKGILPLQTIRSDIDFAKLDAYTTYGTIGIKVWVCKGELKTDDQKQKEDEAKKFKDVFGVQEK